MSDTDKRYTVKQVSEGIFRDRGSRFIARLVPANSIADFEAYQEELRKEFHDARHICYAYRIDKQERANDDGEPSYSAGAPILRQIHSNSLDRVALYVVRYFGGIKLGVSGLVRAYGKSAAEAIANNELVEWIDQVEFQLVFDYNCTSEVERLLKEYGALTLGTVFDDKCRFRVQLAEIHQQAFEAQMCECTQSCITIENLP